MSCASACCLLLLLLATTSGVTLTQPGPDADAESSQSWPEMLSVATLAVAWRTANSSITAVIIIKYHGDDAIEWLT